MAYKYPPPQAGHLFVMCIVSFAVQKHFCLTLSHWFLCCSPAKEGVS